MDQRIAFVTCERLPEIHGDDRLVAMALQSLGFQVTAAVWNDPGVDWRQFTSVVIRAAWDYHLDEARYAAWLRRCETEQVLQSVNYLTPPVLPARTGSSRSAVSPADKSWRAPLYDCPYTIDATKPAERRLRAA